MVIILLHYPCLIENFNGLTTDDIDWFGVFDMMEDQLNINFTAGSGTALI